jgi:hypothetical protein
MVGEPTLGHTEPGLPSADPDRPAGRMGLKETPAHALSPATGRGPVGWCGAEPHCIGRLADQEKAFGSGFATGARM